MHSTAVIDAIKFELTERNNMRISRGLVPMGKVGLVPRPPLGYLWNSIHNARRFGELWEREQATGEGQGG